MENIHESIELWKLINEQTRDIIETEKHTRRPIDVIAHKQSELLWGDNQVREAIFADIK